MKPKLTFGNITFDDIIEYFDVSQKYEDNIINISNIEISKEDRDMLEILIHKHKVYFMDYSEEEIKMMFISPILNNISLNGINAREWFERELSFEFENVIISGKTDFMLASGTINPKEPYFFIQEYKKAIPSNNPKWQLLAELLVAINKNRDSLILGTYIIGQYWYFVKLIKKDNSYILYNIDSYDSLKIDDLVIIYKNLQAVKSLYCK